MYRLLQILVEGRPNREPDFRLPSAEGKWGYPQDMLASAGSLSSSGKAQLTEPSKRDSKTPSD
jgi:hypothetical protein